MNIGGRPRNAGRPSSAVLRADDPRRGARGGHRHVGAQQAAAAVSPGVQRAAVLDGALRPVLPVHRGDGSALRRGDDPVPRGACTRRRCPTLRRNVIAVAPARVAGAAVLSPGHARRAALRAARGQPDSSPTGARRARRSPTPWRAASCARTTRLHQGRANGQLVAVFPMAVTDRSTCRAGRSASTCSARRATARWATGNGHGGAARLPPPASYHEERLRNAPVGYFFDVMTNGFGAMQDYAAQIPVARPLGDRRLHPRAAVQPERDGRRRAGRPPGRARPRRRRRRTRRPKH